MILQSKLWSSLIIPSMFPVPMFSELEYSFSPPRTQRPVSPTCTIANRTRECRMHGGFLGATYRRASRDSPRISWLLSCLLLYMQSPPSFPWGGKQQLHTRATDCLIKLSLCESTLQPLFSYGFLAKLPARLSSACRSQVSLRCRQKPDPETRRRKYA